MYPTEHDYVLLARQAYEKNGGTPHEGWKVIKSSEEDGFYATAYHNPATDQVVIAYRGTEPNEIDHILNDMQILFKKCPYFENFALDFSNDVEKLLHAKQSNESVFGSLAFWNRFTISYTGHSLGGVLGQLTALRKQRKFVVFESPGVKCLVKDAPERYHLDKINGAVINTYPNVINSVTEHVVKPRYIKIKSPEELASQTACELARSVMEEEASQKTVTSSTSSDVSPRRRPNDIETTLLNAKASVIGLHTKWQNMPSEQQNGLIRTGSGLLVVIAKWAFTGLLQQRETLISTGYQLLTMGAHLGHLHSIDNMVDAYNEYNGQPPHLDIDPGISQRIHSSLSSLFGEDVCSWSLTSNNFEGLIRDLHSSSVPDASPPPTNS